MTRRGVFRYALFAAACGAAGCAESGSISVENSGADKGSSRKRLDRISEKASQAPAKK